MNDFRKLAVVGVHAMLFPDEASAEYVNSERALVQWSIDKEVLMDRFDARHLLQDLSSFKQCRANPNDAHDVTEEELNQERYRDLLESSTDNINGEETVAQGVYSNVPFTYAPVDEKPLVEKPVSPPKEEEPKFIPEFYVPDHIRITGMPATLKLHQIISGTAKFVTKHGGQSEIVLRVKQADNPTFGFLMPDHRLHQYFRYLVDNPALTGALEQPSSVSVPRQCNVYPQKQCNVSVLKSNEGLKLVSAAYGSDEDEDEDEAAECKPSTASRTRDPPVMAPYKEPPLQLKSVIEKTVEFISRNGNEFENTVKTRDKGEGKFGFLHPWHEYYPYYVKMLQGASKEIKGIPLQTAKPVSSTATSSESQPRPRLQGRSRFDITPIMLPPANDDGGEILQIVKDPDIDSQQEQVSTAVTVAIKKAGSDGTSRMPEESVVKEEPEDSKTETKVRSWDDSDDGRRHKQSRARSRDHSDGHKQSSRNDSDEERRHKHSQARSRDDLDEERRHKHSRTRNRDDSDDERHHKYSRTRGRDVPDDERRHRSKSSHKRLRRTGAHTK